VIEAPSGTLEALLREDGIQVPEGSRPERMVRCWTGTHDDKTPSMSVNVTKNMYKCHTAGCGAEGNAWTYLRDKRGLGKADIARKLKSMGATEERMAAWARQDSEGWRQPDPQPAAKNERPRWMRAIPDIDRGRKKIAEHDYHGADGTLLCRVARYEKDEKQPGAPKCKPYVPCSSGGWWNCNPNSEALPPEDKRCSKRPLYRLPEVLAALKKNPNRQIWIVEGEKCADTLWEVRDPKLTEGPPPTTTSLFAKFDAATDLSPLRGRNVLLIADEDVPGRKIMKGLAKVLATEYECTVKTCLPPGNAPPRKQGNDIHDVITELGYAGAVDWLVKVGVEPYVPEESTEEEEAPAKVCGPLEPNDHFRVLGLYGPEFLCIQSKITHETHVLKRSQLESRGVLTTIADLNWWHGQTGEGALGTAARGSFANTLIRSAEKRGQVDLGALMGRGALRIGQRYSYNLGDRILIAGEDGQLREEIDIGKAEHLGLFEPGPPIRLQDDPKSPQYGRALYDAVMAYRWHSTVDGRAFLGWIVSAIVGGALPFRPMVWLLANAESGKTYLLENVLQKVFGSFLIPMSDTTEAGIYNAVKGDSIPCYLDEFEPRRGQEHRWEGILGAVRTATSGGGMRIRASASAGGMTVKHAPRFSALVSSTRRPVLSTADDSRFFTVRLSESPVRHWPAVKKGIEDATTAERMLALRTAIIRQTPAIVAKSQELENQIISGNWQVGTRQAQIMAALTAGVGFLCGEYDIVQRRLGVRDDTYAIFKRLLSALVRLPEGGEMSLAEVLHKGWWNDMGAYSPDGHSKTHVDLAARYGFRMASSESLYVATGIDTQAELLRRTEFANVDLADYLRRMPGAMRLNTLNGGRRRMRFGGVRYETMRLNRDTLEAVGFLGPDDKEEPVVFENPEPVERSENEPVPF